MCDCGRRQVHLAKQAWGAVHGGKVGRSGQAVSKAQMTMSCHSCLCIKPTSLEREVKEQQLSKLMCDCLNGGYVSATSHFRNMHRRS